MQGFRFPIWLALALLVPVLSAGAWPAAPAPGTPVTDLVIDAVEVTQSIQDLNNSVPLIKGKRTFVRVFAHSTSGLWPTSAQLIIQTGNYYQFLLPIAPGGPLITVRPTYSRLIPSHAFLFELPLAVTLSNTVTLTAQINPALDWHPRDPEETTYANNALAVTVHFDPVAPLHLVIANQPMRVNNATFAATALDLWKSADWLSRAFPVSQFKVIYRTLPVVNALREPAWYGWRLLFPTCEYLQLYLANHAVALYGNPFYPPLHTGFYGLVTDAVGWRRGCAPRGGLLGQFGYIRAGGGPVGSNDWGWDFDGTYADWYSAHEIGHEFGRPHVRGGPGVVKAGCGGEGKAVKHYPNGALGPTLNFSSPDAIFGFDTLKLLLGQNPILSPFSSDVMTYCDYHWVDLYTYTLLKDVFVAGQAQVAAPTAPLGPATTSLIAVLGVLDPATGALSLLPTTVWLAAPSVPPPAPGPYALVFYDGDGDELARHPFTPDALDAGPSPYADADADSAAVAVLVPVVPSATSLQVQGPGGGLLAQVQAGPTAPSVQVIEPNGGEGYTDEVLVAWTASDEDGDPLTFSVEYSPDNGQTWEPVALFITTTQVTLPPDNLPAGDLALIRVTATDGLHAGQDTSNAVFTVANHLPEGQIITPAADLTVAVSQTVAFEARVYDLDLGSLDAELEWISNQDGSLGHGAAFSTADLSLGLHEVTLSAADGIGVYPLDQVIVIVEATPNDLPAPPNQLTAGPELIFIGPTAGAYTATLYLDNLNLGQSLDWEVTPAQPWVQLSAIAGQTPQELTVAAAITPNDFGLHKSLLTFTSPTDAYDPVYLVVIFDNSSWNTPLPFLRR
ncbi:MAG: fibronectin type III domain-containing protein [Anaerolineales bacterium]|nr:fibronectin type III domain-containing protein [Anaerolineales bacterium]